MTRANDIATMIKDGRFIDYTRIPALLITEHPTIVAGSSTATLSDAHDITKLEVYLNGVLLKQTTEYTISGTTLTLAGGEVFSSGDVLTIKVFKADANNISLAFASSSDVNISNIADGELLKYDSATSKVIPTSLVEDGNGNVGVAGSVRATGITANEEAFVGFSTTSQSIRIIPELSGGGYNPISSAGDAGIIFSTDGVSGTDEVGKGLVIAPHAATSAKGIKIQEDGNVGIGTSSPSKKLHVYRDDTNTDAQVLIEQDGTGDASIGFLRTGVFNWMTGIDTSDNKYKISGSGTSLATNNYLAIDTSGNVGIGTSSPAAQLDVKNGTTYSASGDFIARIQQNTNAVGKNGLSVMNAWANTNSTIFEAAMGWNGTAVGYYPVFTIDGSGQAIFSNGQPQQERMRINSSGQVTKPNQPAFVVRHQNNTLTTGVIVWNVVEHNIGSHYNSTNGRFTAPVTGLYYFTAHTLVQNASSGEWRIAFYRNGSTSLGNQFIHQKTSSTWQTIHINSHVYMNANDYVTVNMTASAGALYSDANYNQFTGHLVG